MKNGETVYHCKRTSDDNAEIDTFDAPYPITLRLMWFTVQPASGYTDTLMYGEAISQYQTAMAQPYQKWHGTFKEGDRFYLDGASPSNDDMEDPTAKNANYVVDSVRNQNMAIYMVLKKRTGFQ